MRWTFTLPLWLLLGLARCTQVAFAPPPSAAEKGPHGRFLHITDLHPDTHYTVNSSVSSGCHHRKPKKGSRAGWWGTGVSECDSPPRLITSSLAWASSAYADSLDFILWTGDSARHDIDSRLPRTSSEIFTLNRWTLSQIETAFPGVPLVPSLGNNDIFPHNILFPGPNAVTRAFLEIWADHIPEYEAHTFEQGGYFVRELLPNRLAAMSLNTLYFYDSNKAVDGCRRTKRHKEVDPGTAQLDWLEAQLGLFRQRGIQVHLIGHVPPTAGKYFPRCYDRYTDIVLRHQDTVVGQHFGHMNTDAFFVQEDQQAVRAQNTQEEEEVKVADKGGLPADLKLDFGSLPGKARTNEDYYLMFYIAPSIIPTYYPSMRVWTYNTDESERYMAAASLPASAVPEEEEEEEEEEEDDEEEEVLPLSRHHHRPSPPKGRKHKGKGKKRKHKKRPKLPRHASPDSPSRRNVYLSLTGYSQYVMDIDAQNAHVDSLLSSGQEEKARNATVEYALEYTTYTPSVLWSEYAPAPHNRAGPVPKALLDAELLRRGASPPTWGKGKSKPKLSKQLRKLTDYALPDLTIGSAMDLARRLVVDKKLWRRFVKRIYSESGYLED